MNPLYQRMMQNAPQNNNLVQRFQQFRSQFRGNPQQQVQELLNSGRITQQQYDAAVQAANQIRNIVGL